MRFNMLALMLLFSAALIMSPQQPAFAQVILGAGEEETPPPVTPTDVREALRQLLEDSGATPEAITTEDPVVALGALSILFEPMTQGDLQVEIESWYGLFREAIADQSVAEMELFEITEALAAEAEAAEDGGAEAANEGDTPEITPEHQAKIDEIGELRGVATGIADRLRLALDAFEAKGGDPATNVEIRTFIADVSGVEVDVTNVQTAVLTIREWATADDGGLRLLRNVGIVVAATLAGLILGWVLGLVLSTGLRRTELSSKLLARFVRVWLGRVGALVGALVGLSWIGTNMTPILAALGAAGFILAFALQNTISNFASGLLILFQRPFDAGDEIEAAGVTGEVEQVSLFSTHLSTAENRKVIVPNNKIWEDVIVNSTGAPTRRLQIEVEVNAEDHSLEEAEETLMQVMKANPGVLEDPAPDLKLSSMGSESLTFICWPWVETKGRDRVRWELVSQFGRELSVLKGSTKASAD